mgnify:CR=1 FL=1
MNLNVQSSLFTLGLPSVQENTASVKQESEKRFQEPYMESIYYYDQEMSE